MRRSACVIDWFYLRSGLWLFFCCLTMLNAGCRGTQRGSNSHGGLFQPPHLPPIHHVACVYDQKPWLSLDTGGDKDPEGIAFRVFLVGEHDRGVHRDGTFHVEMYRLGRDSNGNIIRTLDSDWHLRASEVPAIGKPGRLGEGYFLHLRWARKDTAGNDIEIITSFEDTEGRIVRSGTKAFRVPKYTH